jgi:hypothetical protein
MEWRAADRWAGLAIVAAAVVLLVSPVAVKIVAAGFPHATTACLSEGPYSPTADGYAPGLVDGTITVFPPGRDCEWLDSEGGGVTVTRTGNWSATLLALIPGSVLVIPGVLLAFPRRHGARRSMTS